MIANIAFVLIVVLAAIYTHYIATHAPMEDDMPIVMASPAAAANPTNHVYRPPAAPAAPPSRISDAMISRAIAAIKQRGYTVTRIKNGAASLAVTDPDSVIAWAVAKSKRGAVKLLTTRELIEFAILATGESK